MERFFSHQNIERYRKLLGIATDEPQRRLIFKLLAAQVHTIEMDANSSLRVRVERRATNTLGGCTGMAIFTREVFRACLLVRRSGQSRRNEPR
jgi:hypothetical protein